MRNAAFYVWTETQLVNAVRIRKYVFPDVSADLFLLETGRIPDKIRAFLACSSIFDHIHTIQLPPYCSSRSLCSKLPFIRQLVHKKEYTLYFEKVVSRYAPYELFFTAGFWAESLYFLAAISKDFIPKIYFLEEGLASYTRDSFRCRIDSAWKEWLDRNICFGLFARQAKKNVCGIYLNNPKHYFYKRIIPLFKIPEFTEDSFGKGFFSCLRDGAPIEEYRKRKIIFISSGLRKDYEPDHGESDQILMKIVEICGAEQIVYKPHPTELCEKERLRCLSSLGIYVDDTSYWFESIFSCISWKHKTIISRNSSSVFTLISTQNTPPNLILTYQLYRAYRKNGDPIRKKLEQIYFVLYQGNEQKLCVVSHEQDLSYALNR